MTMWPATAHDPQQRGATMVHGESTAYGEQQNAHADTSTSYHAQLGRAGQH